MAGLRVSVFMGEAKVCAGRLVLVMRKLNLLFFLRGSGRC
jgi:hypothetical protein